MPAKSEIREMKIRKFDVNSIALGSTACFVGKKNSGKSVAVKALMHSKRDIPRGVVFSGTEHVNCFFGEFVPDTFIFPEYDPRLMEKIFKNQTKRIRKDGGTKSADNAMFLVLDDLLSDAKNWKNDRQIRELLMNGRHYGLFSAITLQYPLGIPPDLRTNLDYIFIFREPIRANRKRLYENFAGCIGSFAEFEFILDHCTQDYSCLVINNRTTSNNVEDMVFYWKAPYDIPKFRMGSVNYWRFHDERHLTKDVDSEEESDQQKAAKIAARYAGESLTVVIGSKH